MFAGKESYGRRAGVLAADDAWSNGVKPRFRLERGRLIPIQRMPDGLAAGCFNLNGRGKGYQVTIWPNPRNQLRPLPWNHVRGVPLWNQEMYILARQSTPEIRKRMEQEAARMHWAKLWDKLREIPEVEAIEN